jgi:hypothetical protein
MLLQEAARIIYPEYVDNGGEKYYERTSRGGK